MKIQDSIRKICYKSKENIDTYLDQMLQGKRRFKMSLTREMSRVK